MTTDNVNSLPDDGADEPVNVDPFDLDALRGESLIDIEIEKVVTRVPVRRPHRDEYFQVNEDPAYMVDGWVLERRDDLDKSFYWVVPHLVPELRDELKAVRLYTCIAKDGTVFLWPAKLPTTEANSGRSWHESGLKCASAAMETWIRMKGNRTSASYEFFPAYGDLGKPTWPDKTFKELLVIAFKDAIVDSIDHDVLRELRGEI